MIVCRLLAHLADATLNLIESDAQRRSARAGFASDHPATEADPFHASVAGFTFGDLAEASRIVQFYAETEYMNGSGERVRLLALAHRLGDASDADLNP